jgi:hypothetical protein
LLTGYLQSKKEVVAYKAKRHNFPDIAQVIPLNRILLKEALISDRKPASTEISENSNK